MTLAFLLGGLTFVVGLVVLRPLSIARSRPHLADRAPDEGRRRELLRQLRDLDDDLAAGKLTQADHLRLRGPVEREAAVALRRKPREAAAAAGDAGGAGTVMTRAKPAPEVAPARPGTGVGWGWRRWTLTLLALAGFAGGVTFLLISTVSARTSGQAITGETVPGAAAARGGAPSPAPAAKSGTKSPTPRQLAAVAAAEARVKRNPTDATAHLALAEAYSAAGATQLATVEYLAVTRLDPANPEANTSLALLAFQIGHAAQARAMVDRVLTASPGYSEALYVRGVINLIGLRQYTAAERDFTTYLADAPFGSHRTAAATLRALAQVQGHK